METPTAEGAVEPTAPATANVDPYHGLQAAVLRRSFAGWSAEIVGAFCQNSRIVRLRKGEYLGHTGQPCTAGVLIVLSGSVRAFHTEAGGGEYTVNYLEPGHMIGLIPFFDGGEFMAEYLGHEESVLAAVPDEAFERILAAYPRVARDLLALLSRRIRTLHSTLEHQSLHPVARRLAARLDRLAHRYGRCTDDGIAIDIKLSQDDLAMMLGVTRPTVTRELQALVRSGIVRKAAYSRLVITDPVRLREIAEREVPQASDRA